GSCAPAGAMVNSRTAAENTSTGSVMGVVDDVSLWAVCLGRSAHQHARGRRGAPRPRARPRSCDTAPPRDLSYGRHTALTPEPDRACGRGPALTVTCGRVPRSTARSEPLRCHDDILP